MDSRLLWHLDILLIIIGTSYAVDPDCMFQLTVEPGKTYYIASPNYPSLYTGAHSCQWMIESSSRIYINCPVFEVPSSNNCQLDQVLFYLNGTQGPFRLCGNGTFSRDAPSNQIAVTFQSSSITPGGRFVCYLQAIQDQNNNCRCGWKKPSRIVGGQSTGINEYPMMAGLVDATLIQVFCGAVIISERYILSAAHCLINRPISNLGVLIGDHDLSIGNETRANLFRVLNYVIHPYFVPRKRNLDYDISILTIDGAIKFTNEVGPACLPFHHNRDSFTGSSVDIIGWGTVEFAGATENVLQKATVSVINLSKCTQTYPNLTQNQICTYADGKDACQFDSGGPVLWQNPTTGRLVTVGIISYGISCGDKTPSVNSRVGAFMDWILSVTPDANYCTNE